MNNIPKTAGPTCDVCGEPLDSEGLCQDCDAELIDPPPTVPLKVEKGIPMPEHFNRTDGQFKYPWDRLEVGDSFAVAPTAEQTLAQVQSSLGSSYRRWSQKHGTGKERGRSRRVQEKHGGKLIWVVRIWRAE